MGDIYDDYDELAVGVGTPPADDPEGEGAETEKQPPIPDGDTWEYPFPPPDGFPEHPTSSSDPNVRSPVFAEEVGYEIRRPLIVVPGILATSLEKTEPVTVNGRQRKRTTSVVWPPVNVAAPSTNPADEILDPQSVRPRSDSNNPFVQGAYDGLITFLTQQLGYQLGSNLFLFGYNWVETNWESSKKLTGYVSRVVERTGKPDVDVVCHSMGGLVTRAAIRLWRAPVARTAYLASPHYGAPKAYVSLKGGVDRFPLLYDFLDALARKWQDDYVRIRGNGDLNDFVWTLAKGMQSAYELLPDDEYFRRQHYICRLDFPTSTEYVTDLDETYNTNTYSKLDDKQLERVRRALNFKRSLGVGLPGVHANIAANAHATVDHLVVRPGLVWGTYGSSSGVGAHTAASGQQISTPNGDGTVPYVSASGPLVSAKVVGSHTVMPNLADTHTQLALFLSTTN